MIDEELRKTYDNMIEACLCNLYTCGKDKKEILLRNFDNAKINHLFILEVAKIVQASLAFKVKLEMPWWKFRKVKGRKMWKFKRVHPNKKRTDGINIEDFLQYVQEAYDESPQIWESIYNEFYT